MALDIRGFVTPEQDFPGLQNLSNVFEQQKRQKAAEQERGLAQQKANQGFLSSFLDPKEFMTATVNDPYISARVSKLLEKGMELAKTKGMDSSMLYSALSPEVNKLNRDALSIKELERQRRSAEDILKSRKGIDVNRFNESFKKRAYLNPDGSLKMELSDVDPTYNYVDEILQNEDVYTPGGLNEWVNKQGSSTNVSDKIIQDSNKKFRRTKLEMTAPWYMQPVESNGVFGGSFEPKHEFFIQDGQEVEQEVVDPATGNVVRGTNGKPLKEKVKLLDREVYKNLLSDPENKDAAAYINQEVRKVTKQLGISPNSDNYNLYARKVAYDVLNSASKPKTTFKELVAQKAAPTVINVSTGSKSGGGEVEINDIYSEVEDKLTRGAGMIRRGESTPAGTSYRLPLNELSATAQKVILKYAKDLTGSDIVTQGMFKIQKDDNGNINLLTKQNEIIAPIDFKSINIPAQAGVKSKQKVVSVGNKMGDNQKPPIPPSGSKKKISGF